MASSFEFDKRHRLGKSIKIPNISAPKNVHRTNLPTYLIIISFLIFIFFIISHFSFLKKSSNHRYNIKNPYAKIQKNKTKTKRFNKYLKNKQKISEPTNKFNWQV